MAPEIPDDLMRLIAMCCHPLLSADAQVALTLRMVAGLTTDEIARGCHVPAATVAQRIVRAKRTLAAYRVTFAADEPGMRERLPAILDVIYLVFNEGYLSAAGETLTRGDLAVEAHRLARAITELAARQSRGRCARCCPSSSAARPPDPGLTVRCSLSMRRTAAAGTAT